MTDLPDRRVLFTGSRHAQRHPRWAEARQLINEIIHGIAQTSPDAWVLNGGCEGVDSYADERATACTLPVLTIPADWKRWGKRAGPIRNLTLVGLATEVYAFPGSDSPGTRDTIRKAIKIGAAVYVHALDEFEAEVAL